MSFIVGTMSVANGWETQSVVEAMAKHLNYWFQSRRNQGKVLGKVPSFYYTIKQYGQTPEKLVEQTQVELAAYVKELFPVSEVQVTQENLTGVLYQYKLIIASRVVHEGVAYDLAQAVLITGEEYKLIEQARLN